MSSRHSAFYTPLLLTIELGSTDKSFMKSVSEEFECTYTVAQNSENVFEKIGLKKITEGFGSFSKGNVNSIYSYENINIIPLICYEIIFPELIQKIRGQKNLLINISEDGWFGDSLGPYQHFSKSIFRAIESDSFVLRSANKGLSAVINNKGQIIKSLKNNETGNLEYRLPVLEKKGGNKNDLIFFVLLFTYCFIFLRYKKND